MAEPDFDELDASIDAPPALNGLAESLALDAVKPRQQEPRAGETAARRPPNPALPATPAEATEATLYLRKQARMIDIQMEHLSEQRGLSLSHLRLRRASDYFKLGLQALTILVGLGVAYAALAFVQEARGSHALVIEPLRGPEDLAKRGLDGATLATQLLDKLAAMEAATSSARAPQTFTNNWGDDIKVVIPQTGVSIGELRRYLHQYLGHDTRISGEVYRGFAPRPEESAQPAPGESPDRLFLTVRAGSGAGVTVSGADSELDTMMQQAAERLLAETQPYRHAVYLARTKRTDQGIAAIKVIAAKGAPADRPWAFSYWGGLIAATTGDIAAAAEKSRAALKLDPGLAIAQDNLAGDESLLGHDQAAADGFARSARVLVTQKASELAPAVQPILLGWARLRLAEAQGDYAEVERQAAAIEALPDYDDSQIGALIARATARALRHEPSASRQMLAGLEQTDPAAQFRSALEWDPNLIPGVAQLRAEDDWAGLERFLNGSEAWSGDSGLARRALLVKVTPTRAYVLARTGDIAGAEALIATTPLDCYACVRARGRIAALKGDAASADHWFAEALRQAPGLPLAEMDLARARLDRGDAAGAAALAASAARKAPRFADTEALWGEALLKAGDAGGAIDHFAKAERLTPAWGRLHLIRGEALARLGRREAARSEWRRAAGEDLSAADKMRLVKLSQR